MTSHSATVEFRTLLQKERDQLLSQLAELGFGQDGGLSYDTNFADSSQVNAERGEAEALAAPLREALSEVDEALERVDEGTYGSCLRCSSPIGSDRLEAMPATRYCIACASRT
ncbi:MAG: TraR/DksA C4-type zinc finger protein [Actinomycetota bacterium]|nr:TraR/DksA C4-type zinc finger protein [Actinomycetota bacterium]